MSYSLADSTGAIAEFASIGGYADFVEWAKAQDAKVIRQFVARGYTEDMAELILALRAVVSVPSAITEQIDTLITQAAKAEDVLIISDGMSDTEITFHGLRAKSPLELAADANTKKLSVFVRYAFALARKTVKRGKDIDIDRVLNTLREALEDGLAKRLHNMVAAGGDMGVERLGKLRVAGSDDEFRTAAGPLKFRFDRTNPDAVSWADKHAAELINGITETTRERINDAIAEALEEGTDPFDDILDAIGNPDRAELIARHETIQALSEGQRQAWSQATDKGLLDEGTKRVWIVGPDPCPTCQELEDKTAAIGDTYPGGFDGPPAHVRCECTEGLSL